jgi:hypothetical protein
MCGDSTDDTDVAKLLDGATPFIMVTDPPYGVSYDPTYRSNNRTGKVVNDDNPRWVDAWRLFPGTVAYTWHAGWFVSEVATDLQTAGFELRNYLIWAKPRLQMGRGHYHWQHEPCWYSVRGGGAKWCGDRTQSTVWEIDGVSVEMRVKPSMAHRSQSRRWSGPYATTAISPIPYTTPS